MSLEGCSTKKTIVPARAFNAPLSPTVVEKIPGGYKVKDANGQALAYVYAYDTRADASIANVLTTDEAWRTASNIAKLPTLLGATKESELDFPEGGG